MRHFHPVLDINIEFDIYSPELQKKLRSVINHIFPSLDSTMKPRLYSAENWQNPSLEDLS